ncbi:MAG: hypothetical protein ACK6C0_14265 [Betaproteobacteria bacterium]
MRLQTCIAAALLAGASALAAPTAQAQDKADDWRFRGVLYGYFPSLDGTTQFPSGASGPSIGVDASTLVSNLKFAFMGTFEAQKGKWGALADVFYSDVGGDGSATRDFSLGARAIPADLTANLSLDVKSTIVTLVGTYSLIESPDYSLSALAGVRVASLDQTLDWASSGNVGPVGLPGRSGRTEISATNWDGVVGVRGRARFGEQGRWFVPYYLDLGTGNSQFTWQAVAGIGYAFGWGELLAAWRYIDYDLKSDSPIQSLTFNGPAIGVAFSW